MAANEELNQLSTTDASNTPAGSDVIGATLDNELRSIKANIARSAREESTATASAAATLAVTVLNKIVPVSGSAGGSTTITLPAAATAGAGFRFTAWKTDNTNNVIIDANGAETINGAANYTLATQYEAAQFVTDGTSWVVESTAKREVGNSDLADDSVTNTKLANMAEDRIKGRITAGTGDPEDLTAAQVRTMLLDGAVTINDSGEDVDFRVASDTNTHALFVQGSDGRVGIGYSSPNGKLDIRATNERAVNIVATESVSNQVERYEFALDYNYTMDGTTLATNRTKAPFLLDIDVDGTTGAGGSVPADGTRESVYAGIVRTTSTHTAGTLYSLVGLDAAATHDASANVYSMTGQQNAAFHTGTGSLSSGANGSVNISLKDTATNGGSYIGTASYARNSSGAGTMSNATAYQGYLEQNSTSTITEGYIYRGWVTGTGTGQGITTAYGLSLDMDNGYAGTIGTAYGVYVADEDKNYFSGSVGIGTLVPSSPLEIGVASGAFGSTSALRITTADGGGYGVWPASAVANPVWITGCNSGEIQAWYVGGAEKMRLANGLQLGSPTGGDKGTGTLNATAVYDDNTLLTDFVLDQAVDGEIDYEFYDGLELGGKAAREWDARNLDIDHYEAQWRERKALPSFRSKAERFDSEGKEIRDSVGTLIQGLQQELETAMVHIAQLNARIKQLEEK